MKYLHRLIVTSRTYRLSSDGSKAEADNIERDPENRVYWKRDPRRLEAEIVRDSVLVAAGSLDATLGGKDIDQRKGETVTRRSLYFRSAYEKQMELLTLFDAASPGACYRRVTSIVPQQALALANSPMTAAQSRVLARDVSSESKVKSGGPEEFVRRAFERILSRPPTMPERELCVQFLEEQEALLAETETLQPIKGGPEALLAPAEDAQMRARENLVLALFNHNDFITVR